MFQMAFAGSVPFPATEIAGNWDHLYDFLIWVSVFFFFLIIGGMLYLLRAYRHQKDKKTKYIVGNHLLEAIWIGVPTFLLMVIFFWGYSVYRSMTEPPSDAYEIRVFGKQWLWTFQYDDGRTTVGEVFVPMNRPVKFIMTSEDVLHGFFIPSFRIKQDVVPGMYSSIWFTATVAGKHQAYCTEYCGTSHSSMMAQVNVLDDKQWTAWSRGKKIPEKMETKALPSLSEQGRVSFQKRGCVACHSVKKDEIKIGPSLRAIFRSKIKLIDGQEVTVDENFIRNHIIDPQSQPIQGYANIMPTFKGIITDEKELTALVEYIKSLK